MNSDTQQDMTKHCDIAIIGGGIMGSATACFLAQSGAAGEIAVIEPDSSYQLERLHPRVPVASGSNLA